MEEAASRKRLERAMAAEEKRHGKALCLHCLRLQKHPAVEKLEEELQNTAEYVCDSHREEDMDEWVDYLNQLTKIEKQLKNKYVRAGLRPAGCG